MKKSVGIIASLMLIGTSLSVVTAADEEPSKQTVALVERQTTHGSRDYVRPALAVDDIVEAKRGMNEGLEEERVAAEKNREKERAERVAAREAAHRKAEAER